MFAIWTLIVCMRVGLCVLVCVSVCVCLSVCLCWFLRRILDILWYQHVCNCKMRQITVQPPPTSIIQIRFLMLFCHLARMDESADASRILTVVPQSDWKRLTGRPHTSWLATMKNDLSHHNLSVEDATELALDRPLWRLLAASGAMQ